MTILTRTIFRFLRYFVEAFLTALGWILFGFLFAAGVFVILYGETNETDTLFLPSQLLSSIGTILGYGILMVVSAVLLIIWAKYNQHRFAGVDRRKPPAPLSKIQLCNSFSISNSQFDEVHAARVFVVHHDDDAVIRAVDVINEKTLLDHIERDHQHDEDQNVRQNIAQQSQQSTKQEIKSGDWSFVELWPAIRYDQNDTWVSQCDSYGQSRASS